MKKSLIRSMFLGLVFLAASGNAYALKDELCLTVTSDATKITHNVTLSILDLRAGHVLLHGGGCYSIPLGDGTEASDCTPMHGNGILHV